LIVAQIKAPGIGVDRGKPLGLDGLQRKGEEGH
jgi:hypothetical protein